MQTTTMTRATQRQRGPGRCPSGKKSTRKPRSMLPSTPLQFAIHAETPTQPPTPAPESSPRIARSDPVIDTACDAEIASNSQPIGFRGRREAINAPSTAAMTALRKNGRSAVPIESIAFASRISRTRLAATSPSEHTGMPRASRAAARVLTSSPHQCDTRPPASRVP